MDAASSATKRSLEKLGPRRSVDLRRRRPQASWRMGHEPANSNLIRQHRARTKSDDRRCEIGHDGQARISVFGTHAADSG